MVRTYRLGKSVYLSDVIQLGLTILANIKGEISCNSYRLEKGR